MTEDIDIGLLTEVSEITELNDLHEFLQDEKLDRAMNLVVQLSVKNHVSPEKARALVVELQALSAIFAMKAVSYKTFRRDKAGTENNFKKDVYYSLRDAIDRVVDALKYSAKTTY